MDKAQKELESMSDDELLRFHAWYFDHSREYMIGHILDYSEDLKEELARYKKLG
jgi:hypothetical protein